MIEEINRKPINSAKDSEGARRTTSANTCYSTCGAGAALLSRRMIGAGITILRTVTATLFSHCPTAYGRQTTRFPEHLDQQEEAAPESQVTP